MLEIAGGIILAVLFFAVLPIFVNVFLTILGGTIKILGPVVEWIIPAFLLLSAIYCVVVAFIEYPRIMTASTAVAGLLVYWLKRVKNISNQSEKKETTSP